MILHHALGVEATGADARVRALLLLAREVAGAVLVDYALWSTVGRCTEHSGDASANRTFALHPTLGVRSAGRWQTRTDVFSS